MNVKIPKQQQGAGSAASPRPRARQQRTLDTRERILDAGLEEFAKLGFEGASLPSIATKAGVPHGLITYHFENKDGLWREVLGRTLTYLRARMDAHLEELRGADDAVVLRAILEDLVRLSAENPQFNAVMYHAFIRAGERADWLITEFLKPNYEMLSDLILKAQQKGRFVEGDPIMLQYLFVGAATRVFTASEEIKTGSGQSPFGAQFIEEYSRLCLSLFFR